MKRCVRVLLFALIVSIWSGAQAAGSISVKQLTTTSVVVYWTTDRPSSSKVTYGTGYYGTFSTPDYASHTTSHQMLIDGLLVGQTYQFSAQSIDDQTGNVETTSTVSFPLTSMSMQPSNKSGASVNGQTFQPITDKVGSTILPLLQESRDYVASQSGVSFVIESFLLSCLVFIFQISSVWFLLSVILLIMAFEYWRNRSRRYYMTIYDDLSRKPIEGAHIECFVANQKLIEYTSDLQGRVFFSWPRDELCQLRISYPEYVVMVVLIDKEIYDLYMKRQSEERQNINVSEGWASAKNFNFLLELMAVLSLIPVFSINFNAGLLLTALNVIFIALTLFYPISRYKLLQVIDSFKRIPLHGAVVSFKEHHRKSRTNSEGMAKVFYPVAPTLKLSMSGYEPTEITTDILNNPLVQQIPLKLR